jgi:hypothetical protein
VRVVRGAPEDVGKNVVVNIDSEGVHGRSDRIFFDVVHFAILLTAFAGAYVKC